MSKHVENAFYQQFMAFVSAGFSALDSSIQQEIIRFLKTQQHAKGAFVDRGGKPDLYYSLFGYWICTALGDVYSVEKFEEFIALKHKGNGTIIDQMSVLLIQSNSAKQNNNVSLFFMLKLVLKPNSGIHLSYRLFFAILVLDAQKHKNLGLQCIAKIILFGYKPASNLPCSIISSIMLAKKRVGLKMEREQKSLLTYYCENNGFRAFKQIANADMLSTAVALFALKYVGYDLRCIAPSCLEFIQANYDDGAFLSGDGDKTRDLEYTFYGLLALGILVNE